MITVHDSLYTVEKKNYYMILTKKINKNQKIFSYNSFENKNFLKIEKLKKQIKVFSPENK